MSSINPEYHFSVSQGQSFFDEQMKKEEKLVEIKSLMQTKKKVEFVQNSWLASIKNGSTSTQVMSGLLLGIPVLIAFLRDFCCTPGELEVTELDSAVEGVELEEEELEKMGTDELDIKKAKLDKKLKEKISACKESIFQQIFMECLRGAKYEIEDLDESFHKDLRSLITEQVVKSFKKIHHAEEDMAAVNEATQKFWATPVGQLSTTCQDPKIKGMFEEMETMFKEEIKLHFLPLLYSKLKHQAFHGDELKTLMFFDLLHQGGFAQTWVNMGRVLDMPVTDPFRSHFISHSDKGIATIKIDLKDLKNIKITNNKLYEIAKQEVPVSKYSSAYAYATTLMKFGKRSVHQKYVVKNIKSQESELWDRLNKRVSPLTALMNGYRASRSGYWLSRIKEQLS